MSPSFMSSPQFIFCFKDGSVPRDLQFFDSTGPTVPRKWGPNKEILMVVNV